MRATAALWRHLDFRGLSLAGVGLCWVVVGIGLIATVRPAVNRGAGPLINIMCIEAWGAIWIACGALGMIAGFLRPGRDLWGFAAIALTPLVWGLSFAAAAVTGQYSVGWASVPVYAAILLLIYAIAALTGQRRRVCNCERGGPHGH